MREQRSHFHRFEQTSVLIAHQKKLRLMILHSQLKLS